MNQPGPKPPWLGTPGTPLPGTTPPVPPPPQARPPAPVGKRPRNGVAVTSFAVSLLSLFFIPLFGGAVFLIICGLLSVGLAVAALGPRRHLGRSNWMAVVGAVLGLSAIWSGYHGIITSRKVVRAVSHALNTPVVDANATRGRVRVLHCGEQAGKPFADGTITNAATREQSFRLEIAYKTSDGAIHMTQGKFVSYVPPGKTVHWSIRGYTDFDPASCTVVPHPNF